MTLSMASKSKSRLTTDPQYYPNKINIATKMLGLALFIRISWKESRKSLTRWRLIIRMLRICSAQCQIRVNFQMISKRRRTLANQDHVVTWLAPMSRRRKAYISTWRSIWHLWEISSRSYPRTKRCCRSSSLALPTASNNHFCNIRSSSTSNSKR